MLAGFTTLTGTRGVHRHTLTLFFLACELMP
jgi:hypothetical protein